MGLPYRTRRPTANRCSSFDTTLLTARCPPTGHLESEVSPLRRILPAN